MSRKTKKLSQQIRNIVREEAAPILSDISFRLGQLYEVGARQGGNGVGTVYAEDLHDMQHRMTGFVVTNNSPTAGSIAWTDVHIVFNGYDYAITNGSTALQYVWFKLPATPSSPIAFQMSAAKPVLAEGDVLVFINEAGVARNALSMTNQTLPRILATNAVDNDAIAPNAVDATSIKDLAVTTGKVADGAISKTSQITGKIVGTSQLIANSVDNTILKAGAIDNANKFAAGKIIPGGQIVDNSVPGSAVTTGAITPTKLNTLQHILF